MLPGSILPPSLIVAMNHHESACENEEEYGQKYGRVMYRKWLGSLIMVALVILLVLSN